MKRVVRPLKSVVDSEASLAEAIFPDKELWKNEAGNRYTSEELHEMHRLWDIHVTKPNITQSRCAD